MIVRDGIALNTQWLLIMDLSDLAVGALSFVDPFVIATSPDFVLKDDLEPVISALIPSWPAFQLAGQTSPYFSTNWKASINRSASSTLRPTGRSLIVIYGNTDN